MANTDIFKEYEHQMRLWNKRRAGIFAKNEALIEKWRSVPWYKPWQRPSLEEQREIILRNWSWLPKAPSMPPIQITRTET